MLVEDVREECGLRGERRGKEELEILALVRCRHYSSTRVQEHLYKMRHEEETRKPTYMV